MGRGDEAPGSSDGSQVGGPAAAGQALLARALASGRIHSGYLLAGPGPAPREAALRFARALVCEGENSRPCEACPACRRSRPGEEIPLDGTGRRGPLYRHLGDHPDLYWVERGAEDTRVRIGQIRALQAALRLQGHSGGNRAAVIADAEWLNQEAQNALLRLLEEPPPRTTILLVSASAAGMLATVRSRCQRVAFQPRRPECLIGDAAPPEQQETLARLADLAWASTPDLLDWAEEYRGARAPTAAAVQQLLETASAWLRDRVADAVRSGRRGPTADLDAFATLQACRKSLAQRNANPQMVAERALLALRDAARSPVPPRVD
jgi:DNA polymerase-3 subunit delta'